MPVQTIIKTRRDTAANWVTTNPVLAAGEAGLETDTGLLKHGDGTTTWENLGYTPTAVVEEKVLNSSGSPITKGSVVYISGATGDHPTISLADADTEATSSKTLGFVAATIANGAIGTVITNGLLSGVDTSAATAGQSVWLSGTAGQYVFGNPPAFPANSVYLGVAVKINSSSGSIMVKVQNGYELDELHDVNIGTLNTDDVLKWNGTNAWVNGTLTLDNLSTVNAPSPSDRQVLVYDNGTSQWINGWANETLTFAVSDEATSLTTGTAKVTFRAPFAMTLTAIPRASLSTASSSGDVTVDINEAGTSVLGANKLSIDANEKTSVTAATPTTLADTAIADDAEITVDIDGAGTGAKGLKVTLYYRRA